MATASSSPVDLLSSDEDEGSATLSYVPSTQPPLASSEDGGSSEDESDEEDDIFASAAEVTRRRAAAAKAKASAEAKEAKAAAKAERAAQAERRRQEKAWRSASRSASRSPELGSSQPLAAQHHADDAPAAAAARPRPKRKRSKRSKRPKQFYGVYLLTSRHPSHSRSAYIGFTVNPPRRIRQHNGEVKGGAWKTHKKRPWEMLLVLHGFPSQIVALQFEWAWQQPHMSKPVRDAVRAAGLSERGDASRKVKVLCEMLSVPPWSRYPLTLRWLKPENEGNLLRGCRPLPANVRTAVGSVETIECATRLPAACRALCIADLAVCLRPQTASMRR